jgi:hypothetical protein
MNGRDAERATANGGERDGEETERAIESDIERLRGELDGMVGELDRRRHEAFDVRLQARRHAGLVAAVGAVAVVLTVAGFAAWTSSRRRQDRLLTRLQNLARVVVAMSRHPERLERAMEGRPQPGTAVASALASVAGAAGRRAILGAR